MFYGSDIEKTNKQEANNMKLEINVETVRSLSMVAALSELIINHIERDPDDRARMIDASTVIDAICTLKFELENEVLVETGHVDDENCTSFSVLKTAIDEYVDDAHTSDYYKRLSKEILYVMILPEKV